MRRLLPLALCLSLSSCALVPPFSGDKGDDVASHPPLGQPAPQPPEGKPYPGARAAWLAEDIHPLTDAVAVGATVVVMGHDGGSLKLYGVDPRTGARRWEKDATPSATSTTHDVWFEVLDGGKVGYLEPASPGAVLQDARLVIVDAADGHEVAASQQQRFVSWPYSCQDGEDVVCAQLALGGGLAVVRTDGHSSVIKGPVGSPLIGASVWATRDAVVARTNARDLWRTSATTAFGGGLTPDPFGALDYADQGFYVVTASRTGWLKEEGYRSTLLPAPLSRTYAAAALSASDGHLLWRRDGVWTVEGYLDEAGAPLLYALGYSAGTAERRDGRTQYSGARETFSRLDPATGRDLWTVPLASADTGDTDCMPTVHSDRAVVTCHDRTIEISLPDGAYEEVADSSDHGWIHAEVTVDSDVEWEVDGSVFNRRHGSAVQPHSTGDRPGDVRTPIPSTIGAHVSGMVVIGTPAGLVAYPQPGDSATPVPSRPAGKDGSDRGLDV